MHQPRRRSAGSNAAWNIIGGLSPAILAVVMPPVLTRSLRHNDFGVWVIILQITAIAAALGTVGQISVARYVAAAEARQDETGCNIYISTAQMIALGVCTLLVAAMAGLGLNIGRALPQIPEPLQQIAGVSLLIISIGAVMTIPGGVITGQFIGEQRSYIPNMVTFFGRLGQGVMTLLAAVLTGKLVVVALAHMTGNLFIFGLQWLAQRRLAGHVVVHRSLASRTVARSIWAFSAILLLWQVTALIINGIDLVVLGRIDFKAVPYFAVAATACAILGGVIGSIYNAFLPVATRINETGNVENLTALLSDGLRLGTLFSLVVGVPLILCNEALLRLWIGPEYAAQSWQVMTILMSALLIRTSVLMYVICAVATDTHGRAWAGPVLEAAANLVLSIVLGLWVGSTGVALGTLASSGIGVIAWLALDPLRTVITSEPGWRLFIAALTRPVLVLLPVAGLGFMVPHEARASLGVLIGAALLTVTLGWFLALTSADRAIIRSWSRQHFVRAAWNRK